MVRLCPVIEGCSRTDEMSAAISSGAAIRSKGSWEVSDRLCSSPPPHQRVLTAPGATPVTRTSGTKAWASDLVKPFTAALDTAYGSEEPLPVIPAMLPTFTIAHGNIPGDAGVIDQVIDRSKLLDDLGDHRDDPRCLRRRLGSRSPGRQIAE